MEGSRPLQISVQYLNVDTIRVLIDAGADPGARNVLGVTPLELSRIMWGGGMAPRLSRKERKRIAKEGEVPTVVLELLKGGHG